MPISPRAFTRPVSLSKGAVAGGGSRGGAAAVVSAAEGDRALWAGMLGYLRTNQPELCRQWFEEIEPLGIEGGVLRLRAHSTIHREYLARSCVNHFANAARAVSGRLLSVRFLGPDEEAGPASVALADSAAGAGAAAGEHGIAHAGGANGGMGPAGALPGMMRTGMDGTGGLGGGTMGGGALAQGSPRLTPPEPRPAPTRLPRVAAGTAPDGGTEPGAAWVESAIPAGAWPTDGRGDGPMTAPARVEHLYDDGLVLNPDYDFANFVVGPGNRLSHAAALAVAANPGRAYNPYFVHGGVGMGKTHLLQAMCLRIMAQHRAAGLPLPTIYYTSCEGFMTQFMDAVQAGHMAQFRYKFRHVDVLVIDDIHFLAKRERSQEEFFHTFNSLYQSHKQIVLSSDAAPSEIPDLEERLVSRFNSGLVTRIDPPCYETRVEILKTKSLLRGLQLPEDVACFVAARIDTNIRELEGAIVKLQVLAQVEKRPVDLDMARQAIGPGIDKPEPTVQIQTIINAVTDFYTVKVTDLQGKRRQRSIALPRQLCMFLARRHTRFSLEEIGGHFGGRDHTTVMHAVKTIEARRDTDAEFAQIVAALEDKIRAPGTGPVVITTAGGGPGAGVVTASSMGVAATPAGAVANGAVGLSGLGGPAGGQMTAMTQTGMSTSI